MFESTPLYPDASRYWDLVETHKVTQFYTGNVTLTLHPLSTPPQHCKPYPYFPCPYRVVLPCHVSLIPIPLTLMPLYPYTLIPLYPLPLYPYPYTLALTPLPFCPYPYILTLIP